METLHDPLNLIGHVLDGKLFVEAYVARGGFGVVYRARHTTLGNLVAIKLLRPDLFVSSSEWAGVVHGFREEAVRVASLNHPAIVRVHDYGVLRTPELGEVPWMASEWLAGSTLADELRARGGRDVRACMALMRPVMEALAYAHERRLAHRDVKPSNLMFASASEGSAEASSGLKLLDFGIAKVMSPEAQADDGMTPTTSLGRAFSPRHGAPEQFSGGRTGPWTDVYAMGLVLSEVLTGHPAHRGRTSEELIFAALAPVRPTPAAQGVDVGAWEPVLARAVAVRPCDRFQSMGEFLTALDAANHPAPAPEAAPALEAPPPPRASATSPSRPWVVVVLAASGLALLAMLAFERLR